MTMDIKHCENCNRTFMPVRFWQKFCTVTCRNANFWKKKDEKIQAKGLDPLDFLMVEPPSGPTPAQEAEWQRRQNLSKAESEKQEQEDMQKRKAEAEKVIRHAGIDAPPVFDFDLWKDKQ